MARLLAVIGASYGDEGKGRVVDYFSGPHSLVVRFNGGAQAGHTVVTPSGDRHVFHHFGSGTLAGAKTYLSKFFVLNPILFMKEWEALKANKPVVFVDPEAMLSTPYDMLLNQAAEEARGQMRHGSCGVGINETVVRSEEVGWQLTYKEAGHMEHLRTRLDSIRRHYVPKRVLQLGIKVEDIKLLWDEGLFEHYIADVQRFMEETVSLPWGPDSINEANWESIIFEGAQGLRLDMDNKEDFPYVTRSNTGLKNVSLMMFTASLRERLTAYYVTRPYLTRHGAGPLEHETKNIWLEGFDVKDETNVNNPHQGGLRFAPLDIDRLAESILDDVQKHRPGRAGVQTRLFITCADQASRGGFNYYAEKMLCNGDLSAFVAHLKKATRIEECRISNGPRRSSVL